MSLPCVRPGVRPEFIIALRGNEAREELLVALAKEVPSMYVFQAVAEGAITPSDGADILMWKRRAEPWLVRFLRWVFGC